MQQAQSRDQGMKKPSVFHWDLLWISVVTLVFGLIELPPMYGVIPQVPMHTCALMMDVAEKGKGTGTAQRGTLTTNRRSKRGRRAAPPRRGREEIPRCQKGAPS